MIRILAIIVLFVSIHTYPREWNSPSIYETSLHLDNSSRSATSHSIFPDNFDHFQSRINETALSCIEKSFQEQLALTNHWNGLIDTITRSPRLTHDFIRLKENYTQSISATFTSFQGLFLKKMAALDVLR